MVMLHIKSNGITKCSNMVANILPTDPLHYDPIGMGSKGQNSTFSEQCHVAYQIQENHQCSNMAAHILHADHPFSDPGLGSKDQNSTLSEHSHVAYQIKGDHECSNMVANILPTDPPDPRWVESIRQNSIFS